MSVKNTINQKCDELRDYIEDNIKNSPRRILALSDLESVRRYGVRASRLNATVENPDTTS